MSDGDQGLPRQNSVTGRIIVHLDGSGDRAWACEELRVAMGLRSHTAIYRALKDLLRAEKVAQSGRGKSDDPFRYRLSSSTARNTASGAA